MVDPQELLNCRDLPNAMTQQPWRETRDQNVSQVLASGSYPTISFEISPSTTPISPLKGLTVKNHAQHGAVEIENRGGILYLDNKRLVHHWSVRQLHAPYIYGFELQKEMAQLPVINGCVLDVLVQRPQLIPDTMDMRLERITNNVIFTFAWGTTFIDMDNNEWVQALCYGPGGIWQKHAYQLKYSWLKNYPALIMEGSSINQSGQNCQSCKPCA